MAERNPEQIDFEEELRQCCEARPFVPFEIVTASGEKYKVREALQLALGRSAIILVQPKGGHRVIRKNQITAIQVHEQV